MTVMFKTTQLYFRSRQNALPGSLSQVPCLCWRSNRRKSDCKYCTCRYLCLSCNRKFYVALYPLGLFLSWVFQEDCQTNLFPPIYRFSDSKPTLCHLQKYVPLIRRQYICCVRFRSVPNLYLLHKWKVVDSTPRLSNGHEVSPIPLSVLVSSLLTVQLLRHFLC